MPVDASITETIDHLLFCFRCMMWLWRLQYAADLSWWRGSTLLSGLFHQVPVKWHRPIRVLRSSWSRLSKGFSYSSMSDNAKPIVVDQPSSMHGVSLVVNILMDWSLVRFDSCFFLQVYPDINEASHFTWRASAMLNATTVFDSSLPPIPRPIRSSLVRKQWIYRKWSVRIWIVTIPRHLTKSIYHEPTWWQ